MNVGFIGLGRMGQGMAANLLAAGHQVAVFNRTPGKAEALAAKGAKVAATIAEACAGEAVVTMLANDQAVEEVVFAQGGVLASLAPGALHVSSSTIGIALAERMDKAHAKAGQRFASAPVFGRPEAAAAKLLYIIAAGRPEALAMAEPLFAAMGQRTFHVAETPKSANLVKLSGNFLIASVIETFGEALALAGKGGVDKQTFFEVMTATLFNAPVYKTYGGLLVNERFEPAGFAAPLGLKDIRLTLAAADELQVPMPAAGLIRDRFLTLLAHGGEELDWSAIGSLASRDAGLGPDHPTTFEMGDL